MGFTVPRTVVSASFVPPYGRCKITVEPDGVDGETWEIMGYVEAFDMRQDSIDITSFGSSSRQMIGGELSARISIRGVEEIIRRETNPLRQVALTPDHPEQEVEPEEVGTMAGLGRRRAYGVTSGVNPHEGR